MTASETDVTLVLLAARAGEEGAAGRLWSLVYDQLRQIAHRELSRLSGGSTLATTDLVHEAYVKCVDITRVAWQDQAHFFAIACRAMRQILIDRARLKGTQKRAGRGCQLPLQEAVVMAEQRSEDLLALDEALDRLARHDERLARVVGCRFFGGFSVEETAGVLGISHRTAEREWQRARSYLYRMLQPEGEGNDA